MSALLPLENPTMSSSVLRSWLNSLARAWSRRHCKRTMRSRRPRPTPLEVWQLEERRVPSTLITLASFNNTNGASPSGPLIEDSSGNLFGTTGGVGGNGNGTVYELARGSSTVTVLGSFANGEYPSGGLVEDGSGNLFGTTGQGGAYNVGTVFELAHGSSTVTTLASFNNSHNVNGVNPTGSLVEDSSGNLFGTTQNGGAYNYG